MGCWQSLLLEINIPGRKRKGSMAGSEVKFYAGFASASIKSENLDNTLRCPFGLSPRVRVVKSPTLEWHDEEITEPLIERA